MPLVKIMGGVQYQSYALVGRTTLSITPAASKLVYTPESPTGENLLWDGSFDTGNLTNWSWNGSTVLWYVPRYGTAPQYGGQNSNSVGDVEPGKLMWLTADAGTVAGDSRYKTGPILPGRSHSLGLLSKSTAGGDNNERCSTIWSAPGTVGDWDPAGCNSGRRRSEVGMMPYFFNNKLLPANVTRWASFSLYIPSDWGGGNDFMSNWQWKPKINNGEVTPPLQLGAMENNAWYWRFRHTATTDPTGGSSWGQVDLWGGYQTSSIYYPNNAASSAMMTNQNKGGWTHFVVRMRLDGRLASEGSTGFIDIYQRFGNEAWVHVIHFYANGSVRCLFPMSAENSMGFSTGMYMGAQRVLQLPAPGRTLYIDNYKFANDNGDFNSIFAQMSHDGSTL